MAIDIVMSTELTLTIPTGEIGPKMRKLSPQQRSFVYAMTACGGNMTRAALAAGYGAGSETEKQREKAARVAGSRLASEPKVLEAIKEEAEKRLHSGALIAASTLLEIVGDPLHKDRLKAASQLLDRAGLIIETKHTVNVTHSGADRETVARITDLATKLGLDPKALLGQTGPIIDAEFEEVPREADPPEAPAPEDDDPWTVRPAG